MQHQERFRHVEHVDTTNQSEPERENEQSRDAAKGRGLHNSVAVRTVPVVRRETEFAKPSRISELSH